MTAAQGAGLSETERAALLEAYCRHSAEGRRQVGHYRCEMYVSEVAATVEAIKRTAVAAALTTAAEAIEADASRAAQAWGGDLAWFTSGTKVADLTSEWFAETVRDLIPQEES